MKQVILAWATKKRHIIVDGKVLCEVEHKTSGYSVKNHQYNSLSLSGIPDYEKTSDDVNYDFGGCHSDGIIQFNPLKEQKVKIIERSICKKCLSKYNKILNRKE